ncbi:MAG TPA: DUF2269 family protein [Actinomycetota bacterium]|jgi:uncharacterized membrane protein
MDFLGGSNGYIVLKAFHVLAAVAWVGGGLTQNVLATRLKSSGESGLMSRFARESEWIGTHVYLPSSLVLLGLGIWMVATSAWNFTDLWIIIGILGMLSTVITGSVFLGPTAKKIGEAIAARGPDDPQVIAGIERLLTIGRVDLAVLLIVVVDMVAKPVL